MSDAELREALTVAVTDLRDGNLAMHATEFDKYRMSMVFAANVLQAMLGKPEAAQQEQERFREMLRNPEVVHQNMLCGNIAKITMLQCAHTHGEEAVSEYLALIGSNSTVESDSTQKDGT